MTDLSELTADQLAEKVYGPGGIRPNVIDELVRRASERDQAVRERDEARVAFLENPLWIQQVAETRRLRDALERAACVADHLHAMIDRETWRAHGAEWMGQYEGDHHAEQVANEIKGWSALAAGGGKAVDA